MSLCLDTSAVLSNPPSSASNTELNESGSAVSCESITFAEQGALQEHPQQQPQSHQTFTTQDVLPTHVPLQAKLVFANNAHAATAGGASQVIQKVPTTSVITVVNATGPLTILKTFCSNSNETTTQQFTLVNSAPLSVCNTMGKPITVVNAPPITVVRAVSNLNSMAQTAKENAITTEMLASCASAAASQSANGLSTGATERHSTTHNVFVKNTSADTELLQGVNSDTSQKLVPVSNFAQNNVIQSIPIGNTTKIVNSQKSGVTPAITNKIKVLNNVVVSSNIGQLSNCSSTNQNSLNIVLNKNIAPKHYSQQKITAPLQTSTKLAANKNNTVPNNLSKLTSTAPKTIANPANNKVQKYCYSQQKPQIKTLPATNNYSVPKSGVKSTSPQFRGIANAPIQKTTAPVNAKLRTLPSQRSPKLPNKPNYIGKHAIQGQKYKGNLHGPKTKSGTGGMKVAPPSPNIGSSVFAHRMPPANTGVMYHQVLTANILQSLSENNNSSNNNPNRNYEYSGGYEPPARGNNVDLQGRNNYADNYTSPGIKPQSNLETLSFVCQAVLLDHNYNAAPPPESPTQNSPPSTLHQYNGGSVGSYYSPSSSRNRMSLSSSNTLTTLSSTSTSSILPINNNLASIQDDDAASDISCVSDPKGLSEGEDTDTAPEAEAEKNESYSEHYGDYVTRCICGLLHDDGYMIECDKCKVWQHVRCVIKSNRKVPEDYLCEVCDTSKVVDRIKARSLQQQWLKENEEREAKLRKEISRLQEAKLKETKLKEARLKERVSDSDTSDGEQPPPVPLKNRSTNNAKRKTDQGNKSTFRQRRELSRQQDLLRKNAKRKEKKTKKKPKPPPKNQSDEDNHDTWQHTTMQHIPQLRQWIDNYEDAVTNHYSPELRARISSIRINGAHSELSNKIDSSVHMCQVHTQPLTGIKYLISSENLDSNTPVIELRGKYMLSTQHRSGSGHGGGGSLSTRQHSQRPGPFLFFYRLHKDNTEVCVDTRTYGNDARFIRRSCTPNAELQHCIEKGVLHLYIVTIVSVDKNCELTVKHESHDLAVVGTTSIACACGKSDECAVNKAPVKKNGENNDRCSSSVSLRKRRGRRTVSTTSELETSTQVEVKEEIPVPPVLPPPPVPVKQEPIDIKIEEDLKDIQVECDLKPSIIKEEKLSPIPPPPPPPLPPVSEEIIKEEDIKVEVTPPLSPPLSPPLQTKKSACKSESEDKKDSPVKDSKESCDKKKLSREERKIEAYMKAFERMEKQQLKKQEHQAKQAHRRESEPSPYHKEDDSKIETIRSKRKNFRRKGRSRTVSTHSSSQSRRNRLNSADSSYATSGEECLLSPNVNENLLVSKIHSKDTSSEPLYTRDSALVLNIPTHTPTKIRNESPVRDVDCNSNSANSSPETPLSSACLLVAAAVEPLEPSFKFPKTKKGLMNEWLNKSPECIQSASSISPSSLTSHFVPPNENSSFYEPNSNGNTVYYQNLTKNFVNVVNTTAASIPPTYSEVQSQPHGNAKKRWLRQAISEDRSESPCNSRPDSPSLSEMVAPPKKRRLPRESLSSGPSPPTTPTGVNCLGSIPTVDDSSKSFQEQEDRVEIVTAAGCDGESPPPMVIDDATLSERVAEMQQEIGACFRLPEPRELLKKEEASNNALDPRLTRPIFNTTSSEHLVAAVEKNLSILGFEDQKQESSLPAKRKLSITEYRKRKQLIVSEKSPDDPTGDDTPVPRPCLLKKRLRSNSASSTTSVASTDEEEPVKPAVPEEKKILSAFNSEPTEIEKHRESVSLRLKKAFGLSVDDESHKTTSSVVESFLNCGDILNVREKRTSPSSILSPVICDPSVPTVAAVVATVPLPGLNSDSGSQIVTPSGDKSDVQQTEEEKSANLETHFGASREKRDLKPELFYSPDDDDVEKESQLELSNKKRDEHRQPAECINYVPPFNNPVYPNSSFTSFGSVIDDDAPYEGRNPSPPPELSSGPGSYLSP